MKFVRLLTAVFAVILACPTAAHAMACVLSSTNVTTCLPTPSGSYLVTNPALTPSSDLLTGYLGAESKISITYTYTGALGQTGVVSSPYYMGLTVGAAELTPIKAETFGAYLTSSYSSGGAYPVLAMASLNNGVGSVEIINYSDTGITFESILSLFSLEGGSTLVSYVISSVPLPPALLLFCSGLVAFAGFGRRKQA